MVIPVAWWFSRQAQNALGKSRLPADGPTERSAELAPRSHRSLGLSGCEFPFAGQKKDGSYEKAEADCTGHLTRAKTTHLTKLETPRLADAPGSVIVCMRSGK